MPSLLEIQHDLGRHLIGADTDIPLWIEDGRIAAADGIAVHRNTFAGAIVGALRISYPVVQKLVGEEFFDAAAQIYLQRNLPRSAYLNDYGETFPQFLAGFPPAATLSYLPEVAALEWAVASAANAPDAPTLHLASLANLEPVILERSSFKPHPSVRLLEIRGSADLIWRAVLAGDEAALARIAPETDPVRLLLYRNGEGVDLRRMSMAESRITAKLCIGLSLVECFADTEASLATALLSGLLSAGIFAGIDGPEPNEMRPEPEVSP
jgi:hypothetical protein